MVPIKLFCSWEFGFKINWDRGFFVFPETPCCFGHQQLGADNADEVQNQVLRAIGMADDAGILKVLEEVTSNADEVQNQVLQQILSQNSNTEYLRRFHLPDHEPSNIDGTSFSKLKQVFKERVPIVEYQDIKSYIQRVACGEPSNLICAQPITEFVLSSGTSGGQQKLIPCTAEDMERRIFFRNYLIVSIINKYVEGSEDKGKTLCLLINRPQITTPSGLVVGPISISYYKNDHLQNHRFTSPKDIIFCPDTKQSMYCHLLCGLVQRDDVIRILGAFASSFLHAINFLETYWKEMCSNIRTGHVSNWITDISCRNAASLVLGNPSPELAHLIEMECGGSGRSSWEGIIKRLWPRTKYIHIVITGSMSQYVPTLEFYCGQIPLVSPRYSSSECFFGVNMKPLSKPSDVSYTFLPNSAYFEFLPVDKDGVLQHSSGDGVLNSRSEDSRPKSDEVVDLVDVQVGYLYEPVVTTFAGLYRYRVGDLLMVTDFHNNAPQFQFVERRNVVLSINVDKTSEKDLFNAITKAKVPIEQLGILLTNYTSYVDTSSFPGHYVLFWELIKKKDDDHDRAQLKLDPLVMEECCSKMEEMLDSVYRSCRKRDKSIGALEIRVVKPGTFDAMMDFFVSMGTSMNQYKTPRCMKSKEAIKILDSGVVGKYFSQNVPSWDPFQALVECIS